MPLRTDKVEIEQFQAANIAVAELTGQPGGGGRGALVHLVSPYSSGASY